MADLEHVPDPLARRGENPVDDHEVALKGLRHLQSSPPAVLLKNPSPDVPKRNAGHQCNSESADTSKLRGHP